MFYFLLKGILIGFMIAVPVGPIDMMCIRRSLLQGSLSGFIMGMGAAFADAIYCATAAFGVITLTAYLLSYKILFQIVGGLFLCCLGLRNCRVKRIDESNDRKESNLTFGFLTTFFLALLSPMTILSFIGAFAVLGVGFDGVNINTSSMLTIGVFLGSTLWWFILCHGVTLFKNRMNIQNLQWINRFSGIVLLIFGFIAIGHALLILDHMNWLS